MKNAYNLFKQFIEDLGLGLKMQIRQMTADHHVAFMITQDNRKVCGFIYKTDLTLGGFDFKLEEPGSFDKIEQVLRLYFS